MTMEDAKFWMITDDGNEWLTCDPDDLEHADGHREARDEEVTLEAIADIFDQDAENINAHDYVTCHRGLAALLHKHVGRGKATVIFRDLAKLGGLHRMLGICGRGDEEAAAEYLGVPLGNWKDWKLTD